MGEPKLCFDSQKEAFDLLEEWQKRLFLDDWWIGMDISSEADMPERGNAGYSEVQWVNKCGTIWILKAEEIPKEQLIKQPQELTIIHELLHFKFFATEPTEEYESQYYYMKQHQLLEEMAKSLYMAKYGIGYNWFIPEERKEENNREVDK